LTTQQVRGLPFWEFFDYNTLMARPRKAGALRMNTDLRIPLTSEQKQVIDDATADEPEGKAAWARAILLRAARDRLAKAKIRRAEHG
jgi:hypothetical protein